MIFFHLFKHKHNHQLKLPTRNELLEKLLTCWASLSQWEFSSQTHFPVIIIIAIIENCENWMWERNENQAIAAAVSASEKHFPQKPPAVFSLINAVHIIIMCIAPFFMYFLSHLLMYTLSGVLCFMIAHSHAILRRWWRWCTHIVYIEAYTYIFWDV